MTEESKGGVFKLIGSLDTKVVKEDSTVNAAPLFKPFNFSSSTFGGQTIPDKPIEVKATSEVPLFAPAKATGDSVFDK